MLVDRVHNVFFDNVWLLCMFNLHFYCCHSFILPFVFSFSDTFSAPLAVLLVAIALVLVHPDPVDPTPSFDDGVSFVFTCVGVVTGTWVHARSSIDAASPWPATVKYSFDEVGLITTLARIVVGVGIILAWRVVAKKFCYAVLPTVFRALGLPARKFHLPAKMYDSVQTPIRISPSVMHLDQAAVSAAVNNDVKKRAGAGCVAFFCFFRRCVLMKCCFRVFLERMRSRLSHRSTGCRATMSMCSRDASRTLALVSTPFTESRSRSTTSGWRRRSFDLYCRFCIIGYGLA